MDQVNAVPSIARDPRDYENLKRTAETASQLSPDRDAIQPRSSRDRLLDRLETAESSLILALQRIRDVKQKVKYGGMRDGELVANLVEEFARLNFLYSL